MTQHNDNKTSSGLAVDMNRLVLCEYRLRGKTIKRWVRPDKIVAAVCKQCGDDDFMYARDAATHQCLMCFAVGEENSKADS